MRAAFRLPEAAPLLSAAEERDLARRVSLGDAEARDLLVRANLRLVSRIARDYAGRGLEIDDLIAEGNLGLIRAAESFDPEAGTRFSTYACYWIKQSIRNATLKQGPFVRLPQYMVTLLAKWRRIEADLGVRLGRAPEASEVASELGLSRSRAVMATDALRAREASPRQENDESGPALEEWSGREEPADAQLAEAEDREAVLGRLALLGAEASEVVRLRYGLDGGGERTLREVGRRIGLSHERVRQLERDALRTMAAMG